jgi:predicted RNase H-like HicB family nuclease
LDTKFTAIIEQGENGWFVGQIGEVPAAISQGKTIDELKENLLEALRLILDTNKESTEKEYSGKHVIIEELELTW